MIENVKSEVMERFENETVSTPESGWVGEALGGDVRDSTQLERDARCTSRRPPVSGHRNLSKV